MNKVAILRLIDLLTAIELPLAWEVILNFDSATWENITCRSNGIIEVDDRKFTRIEDAAEYIKNETI